MEQELSCNYNSRSSFHGKARTITEGDRITLISYSTEVAYIEDGKAVVLGQWSQTTSRHIIEFLKQQGFVAENMDQILKDYADLKIVEKEVQ